MKIRNRDVEFQAFYEAEWPRLYRLSLLLSGDQARAGELVQEALLKTYVHWGKIRNEAPGPYVRSTLVNLVRNEFRRRRVERKHAPRPPAPADSPQARVDEVLRVAAALRRLSAARRAVVVLRYYEDLPQEEIAALLERPVGSVKSDLHRALKQLRELLDDDQVRGTK